MKSVEAVARSVEEAVEQGLTELGATRDEVEITIIDEGKPGLFGILGSKQAKVKLELKFTANKKAEAAVEYMKNILKQMDVEAEIDSEVDEEKDVHLAINGENLGLLIGRRGQTLDALQYLTNMAVNRQGGDWVRVNVDIEGYRSRREDTLKSLADRLATKVKTSGRRVALDPMTALERRIIHSELQEFPGVETHSEGRDPYRRVIIVPKK